MKRPTSQPHSPSPHGLWSAHRLLQHLKQASRTMLFSSTYWINLLTKHKLIHWLFNILSSPFWLHTCDLYNQHFQSCWEISQLGTMTWERQKFWQKKVSKKCETQSTYWDTQHRRAFLPLPQHRCLEPCIGCGRCLNRDPAITSIKIAKLVTSQFVSISIWYKVFLWWSSSGMLLIHLPLPTRPVIWASGPKVNFQYVFILRVKK